MLVLCKTIQGTKKFVTDDGSLTADVNKAKIFRHTAHLVNFVRQQGTNIPTQCWIGFVKRTKVEFFGMVDEELNEFVEG